MNPVAKPDVSSPFKPLFDVKPDFVPTGSLLDILERSKRGFKPGELVSLFAQMPPLDPYPRTNFSLYMLMRHLEKNPDLKVVFPVSYEWSEYDEQRLYEACRKMGLELKPTN